MLIEGNKPRASQVTRWRLNKAKVEKKPRVTTTGSPQAQPSQVAVGLKSLVLNHKKSPVEQGADSFLSFHQILAAVCYLPFKYKYLDFDGPTVLC